MRRGMLLCVVVCAAMVVLGVPGAALAGGGCHSGVTENDATGEDATVRMIDACFTATVTTVDPGAHVTFANTDLGVTHNVGGNQWGHFEDMIEGDAFTITFDEPGVYPFACNYHPGMTGAIVVGNGKGITGSGESISVQPFEPPANNVTTLPVADAGRIPAGVAIGMGLGGLALGAGVALGISRLGRARATA